MEATIERITPERVEAAYAKCGKHPIQEAFFDGDGGCCPLTAVALAEHADAKLPKTRRLGADQVVPHCVAVLVPNVNYRHGFTQGFDFPWQAPDGEEDEFKQGHADGVAVAIRLGLSPIPTPEEHP